MKIIWIYVYLFILLFGPKIYGVVDTSIIVNVFSLFFLYGVNLRIGNLVGSLILWIFFIILCYMGVAIYYDFIDIVFLGRLVRSVFSIFCIYGFCCYFAEYPLDEKMRWLTNVLMIHAILVILSATIFVGLQESLSVITDYHKRARMFRSTGFMAGFDISGLLCNIGVVLILLNKKFNVAKFFIFVIAVLLTSRFSIVLLFCALMLYLLFFKKEEGFFKFFCVSFPLLSVGGIILFLLALTTSGILPEMHFFSTITSSHFLDELSWTYAQSDFEETAQSQFIFPNTFLSLIFGLGIYDGGDPGYVRIINCVGLFGLGLILLWHAFLFHTFFAYKTTFEMLKRRKMVGVFFVAVIIFLNLKNSYFFTGTFFEILLYTCYNYILSKERSA